MSLENDRYRGTTADLSLRKDENNQPTDEMVEMISKAGKWARIISYASLLGLILSGLFSIAVLLLIARFSVGALLFVFVIFMLVDYVILLVYQTTKRYANIARELEESDDLAADIAECFELHTRFIKIMTMAFVVGALVGIAVAIAMPAYQSYLLRSRSL